MRTWRRRNAYRSVTSWTCANDIGKRSAPKSVVARPAATEPVLRCTERPFDRNAPRMPALTKANLAEALRKGGVHLTPREAEDLVGELFDTVADALADGEEVLLSGCGRFRPRDKDECPARNPGTGEPVPVPARRVVSFRSAPKLNAKVQCASAPNSPLGFAARDLRYSTSFPACSTSSQGTEDSPPLKGQVELPRVAHARRASLQLERRPDMDIEVQANKLAFVSYNPRSLSESLHTVSVDERTDGLLARTVFEVPPPAERARPMSLIAH